jgi:hypothetical protein
VNEKHNRTIFVLSAIGLVYTFIRALMPVDEAPSQSLNVLTIVMELGWFTALVGMAPRILRSASAASRAVWIILLAAGVIAGLGVFGIRLSGGPHVELPPRTSSTSTSDGGLRHQLREQLVAMEKLGNKLMASRWLQIFATQDPVKVRTLTRQDLQEARALCGEMRECIDRILKVFADATAKGVAHSTLSKEPGAARPESWQVTRELYNSTYDYLGLIEQHWDEWLANPFPTGQSDLKPWQLEVQRLIDAAKAAARQSHALLNGADPKSVTGNDAATLGKQLQEFIDRGGKLNERLEAARWITLKKNPTTARTRTRQDLQDLREIFSQYRECADGAMKVIAQAESKGIDLTAFLAEKAFARLQFWSVLQQWSKAFSENLALIDQHWEEWKTQPEAPDEKSMKPWQREMKRLNGVIDAKSKELETASDVAAATPTAAPLRAPSPPGNNFKLLTLHMLAAVVPYRIALDELQETRWIKSADANAYHPQKITRADLHDAGEKLRKLIATIDKVRKDLDAQTLPVPASEKEYWRIKHETSIASQQLTKLLEDNWKEWHVSGIQPKTGEPKPWQKEALRLQGEIDKLKQIDQTSILL